MAAKIVPSLRSSLERLKHAGSINGLCLAWRRQILINLFPYQDFRVEQAIHAVQEAREHYAGGGHDVKQLWFGFDGVQMLVCFHGECALMVLHCRAVEVDFIARAGAAFLEDAQLLVDAALNPGAADVNDVDTTRLDVGDEDFGSQVTRLVR